MTDNKQTCLTPVSTKFWLAVAGVTVDTVNTRSTITACVINTLIYVCKYNLLRKLFSVWVRGRYSRFLYVRVLISKIQPNSSPNRTNT